MRYYDVPALKASPGALLALPTVSTMAQFGRYRLLIVAVVFHLVYIYSIFSTYFVSPIVHGMREHRVDTQEAPAKRLVLFVGR